MITGQSEPPTAVLFEQFARITGALAAPSRLKLLDHLCQGEQTVEQLATATGLSLANTSRHLRVLAEARLVAARRASPYAYYRLADDAVGHVWLALRDLARNRLAEVDRAVDAYLAGDQSLTPISRDELLERIGQGDVVVLDVRSRVEYLASHLPGAVSIPLDELEERVAELPADRKIVAYCRGPYCFLAVEAVRKLRAAGVSAVRLQDGIPEWKAAGFPLEMGAS